MMRQDDNIAQGIQPIDPKRAKRISKFLSLVLRHRPRAIGLALDAGGWVDIDELLRAAASRGRRFSRAELYEVVRTNDKQRFSIDRASDRVRANQGHSVPIELGLEAVAPPALLYHGTVGRFLESIAERGLLRDRRHHVHLSSDQATAEQVAARRGAPVVLQVDSAAMSVDGQRFYRSANGVWLCESVPARYLINLEEALAGLAG